MKKSIYAICGSAMITAAVASGGGRSGGTYAPVVNVTVNATGKDLDEEKIAQLAGERTIHALKILVDQDRHAHGMVTA